MRPKFDDSYSHFLDYLMPVFGLAFLGLGIFLKTRGTAGGSADVPWNIGFYICLLIAGALLVTSVPKLIKRMKGGE